MPYFHNNVRAGTTWKKEMSLSNLKDYMLGQKNCNYKTQQKALEVFFKCVMVFYDQEPAVTQDFVKSLVTLLDHPSVMVRAKTVEILSKLLFVELLTQHVNSYILLHCSLVDQEKR